MKSPRLVLIYQLILMTLVIFSAHLGRWMPPTTFGDFTLLTMAILGSALLLPGIIALGRTFTIEAIPRSNTTLKTCGVFRWIRNPMYTGGILMCFAWAIWHRSTVGIGAAILLIPVLRAKVRIEETALRKQFGASYLEYCQRVGRFIPFIK